MANKPIPMFRPENRAEARKRIQKLWFNGAVMFSKHARDQMVTRKLTALDVGYVIQHGRIVEHAKGNTGWKYTMKGRDPDGRHIGCVVEINGRLIVITVLD